MASDLNTIFSSAQQTLQASIQDESIRSLASAPLVREIGVSSSLGLTDTQNQSFRIGAGGDRSVVGGATGSRAQLAPNPANKIPRVYGEVVTGGVITDIYQANANNIFACFVLSEFDEVSDSHFVDNNQGGVVPAIHYGTALQNIYVDNYECTYLGDANRPGNIAPTGGTNPIIQTLVDLNSGAVTNIASTQTIKVYAWAGNSAATSQIFGQEQGGDGVAAYDIFPGWDSNKTMANTVFAIVQINAFDDGNVKINKLGNWKFNLLMGGKDQTSGTRNPAVALYDYLTNDRYGAGLVDADLDLDSFTIWGNYCNEVLYYDPAVGSTVTNIPGFRIGAHLNTDLPISDNVRAICDAGMASLAYDYKSGKFKVNVNGPLPVDADGKWAADYDLFVFSDDNITSGITVNSTDLYSLYNFATMTFPNLLQLDKQDSLIVQTDPAELNTNEPVSGMGLSLEAVNFRPQAAAIANISLKQSRENKVISFTGDHNTLSVDVGDVVAIDSRKLQEYIPGDGLATFDSKWEPTSSMFLPKNYYKVIRATESNSAASLSVNYTLLEMSDFPLTQVIYSDAIAEPFATGVMLRENYPGGGFETAESQILPDLANVYVYSQLGGRIDNYDADTGTYLGEYPANIFPGIWVIPISNDGSTMFEPAMQIYYNYNALTQPTFNIAKIELLDQSPDPDSRVPNPVATWNPGPTMSGNIYQLLLNKLPKTSTVQIQVTYHNIKQVPDRTSQVYLSAPITIVDNFCTGNSCIDTYGNSTQIVQTITSFTDVGPLPAAQDLIATRQHDVTNIAPGEFDFACDFTPVWSGVVTPPVGQVNRLSYDLQANITFVNNSNVDSRLLTLSSGITFDQANIISGNASGNVVSVTNKMYFDPDFHGLDAAHWYPSRCNVSVSANSSYVNSVTVSSMDYSITKKSRYYRNA